MAELQTASKSPSSPIHLSGDGESYLKNKKGILECYNETLNVTPILVCKPSFASKRS